MTTNKEHTVTTITADPIYSGDPCPSCGMETDTDKCGPLYCHGCGWQSHSCEHGLVLDTEPQSDKMES